MRLLADPRDALQARIDLIQQAQREICISYYVVVADEMPLAFFTALRDAARRGVTVRFLIDGTYNHVPGALQAHLIQEGVQIREFRPLPSLHLHWLCHRLHDKLLLIDGEQYITGGRNIKDEYYENDPCQNFRDRDIYVRGCTAHEAYCYYMCVWNTCDARPTDICNDPKEKGCPDPRLIGLENGCNPAAVARAAALLDVMRVKMQASDVIIWESGTDWSRTKCALDVPCVRFLHNDCPLHRQPTDVRDDIFALIDRACHCIWIETPYCVLSDRMKHHLAAARRRGVQVTIITNSLATNNHTAAQSAYANQKRWLLRHNIDLWEYAGPLRLHGKAMLIDHRVSVIGTTNYDPLSENRNLEVAVVVHDTRFAAQLMWELVVDRWHSWHIGRNGKAIQTGTRNPGATAEQLKKFRRLRIVAPIIKHFL